MPLGSASQLCLPARIGSQKQKRNKQKQATSKQKTSKKQVNTITLKTCAPGIGPMQPRSQVRILGRWAVRGDAATTARVRVPSAVVNLWQIRAPCSLRTSAVACCRKKGNHKKRSPATTETIEKPTTETIKNVPCHDGNY